MVNPFIVIPTLEIVSAPSTGSINGGIIITINGINIGSGVANIGTSSSIVSVPLTVVSWTQVTFILPSGSCQQPITVTIGGQTSNSLNFQYNFCPCSPGSFGPSSSSCTVCPADHYCSGGEAAAIPCGNRQYSPVGSDEVSDCECRSVCELGGDLTNVQLALDTDSAGINNLTAWIDFTYPAPGGGRRLLHSDSDNERSISATIAPIAMVCMLSILVYTVVYWFGQSKHNSAHVNSDTASVPYT
jgi:hypothetical protein